MQASVQADDLPNPCWDCGGPTDYPGSRCVYCKYKVLPPRIQRAREKRFNQEPNHRGKTGMYAGFALMIERMHGYTRAEAVERVRGRFPSIDWDAVRRRPKAEK